MKKLKLMAILMAAGLALSFGNSANAEVGFINYQKVLDNQKNDGEVKIERKPLSDLREDYLKSSIFVGFIIFFMLSNKQDYQHTTFPKILKLLFFVIWIGSYF